jgi:hypothetical protein
MSKNYAWKMAASSFGEEAEFSQLGSSSSREACPMVCSKGKCSRTVEKVKFSKFSMELKMGRQGCGSVARIRCSPGLVILPRRKGARPELCLHPAATSHIWKQDRFSHLNFYSSFLFLMELWNTWDNHL